MGVRRQALLPGSSRTPPPRSSVFPRSFHKTYTEPQFAFPQPGERGDATAFMCVRTLLPEEGGGRADTQAFRLALHGQDPRGSQALPCSKEAGLHALLMYFVCLFLVSLRKLKENHIPSPSSLTFKGTA